MEIANELEAGLLWLALTCFGLVWLALACFGLCLLYLALTWFGFRFGLLRFALACCDLLWLWLDLAQALTLAGFGWLSFVLLCFSLLGCLLCC